MNIIAERIKEVRTDHKLSQSAFGEMLEVSQDTVSLWENGKSLPALEYLIALCKRFSVSADYILGLTKY